MSIHIRLASPADADTLNALIPESVRGLSQNYYTPDQIEAAIVHIFGLDTQLIADQTYYVAEVDGEIAGCGGWSKRKTLFGGDQAKEQEDPLLDPHQDAGRIRAFFVHPNFARRGIGRHIIVACEEAARAEGFTRMELVATLPGEPLYAAMGYTVMEYFDIPMDGVEVLPAAKMGRSLE